ncbi:MAG: hypothetical protein HY921_10140 [Elusimicrobia bacterium]|nr:hypothetical protein [Elusimicrobiota bacterium]
MSKHACGVAVLLTIAFTVCGVMFYRRYVALSTPPTVRLADGAVYPEMPADGTHRYLRLPLDHHDPTKGAFTGFYILSPRFAPARDVVFVLTDGQQELVDTRPDMEWFTDRLGNLPYVLIGSRGHAPTLLPEVYRKDGALNYAAAINLYGSAQRVEDIESVRRAMEAKGLLPPGGKIDLYGGSGGGFLVQQYLAKYGRNVRRALIESSGAPDLAYKHGTSFSRGLAESDPRAAELFSRIVASRGNAPALAFLLGRLAQERLDGQELVRSLLEDLVAESFRGRLRRFHYALAPGRNWMLVRHLMRLPAEDAVKVRMYELLGADLGRYASGSPRQDNLMYEWCLEILDDFIKAGSAGVITPPAISLDRSTFAGEVLVFAGARDSVFGPERGLWISGAYPHSRFALFDDVHRLGRYPDYYRRFREAFFTHGLASPAVEMFFQDKRQVRR